MVCCVCELTSEPTFWQEIVPTAVGTVAGGLISLGLGLLMFRKENKRDSDLRSAEERTNKVLRQEEIQVNWYANVIISPNLSLIEEFFRRIQEMTKESMNELHMSKDKSVDVYNELRAEKLIEIKNELRQFDFDFVSLVQSFSNSLSEQLRNWSMELDDQISKDIDQIITTAEFDVHSLSLRISEKKANFYFRLFQPLKMN